MCNQTQSNTLILICSLNVNHLNTATHAAMYIIAENKLPPFDIFLIQEPWWEKINQEYKTVAFTGWQTILPKCPVQDTERPRVAAYYRLGANLEVTLQNDILTDLDIMVLEAKRERDPAATMRLINIYNQKELSAQNSQSYTFECLARTQWDATIPTIITGDWNIRHPQWDNGVTTACPQTHETLEWLEGNGFTLCNQPYIPTREDTMGHASVINLTFKTPQ